MNIKWISVILVLHLLGMWSNTTHGGSFYNSRGLGEIKYYSNAQAMGMGGSLIAVPDQFQINLLNPAGLVFIPLTRLSGDFLHEAIWNKTDLAKGFSHYTNLNGIALAIPVLQNRLVTALSIIPTTQFDYEYAVAGLIDDFNYTKKIIANGGLNRASFGFGYAVTKYFYLGSFFHYNFGKLDQTWKVDYVSDLFWDSSDYLSRKMWGLNWCTGLILRPIPHIYMGIVYSGKYKLTFQEHITNSTQKGSLSYDIDSFKREKKQINIPDLWGLGVTYVLKEKYRFSSDLIYQPWSKFREENKLSTLYNDFYHVSMGVEMLPSKNILSKYYQKLSYRLGYFYDQLDFQDDSGHPVSEYGLTMGAGFPYYGSFGRIDVALRFGKRGNLSINPVEEDIFQIYISITGGEKWFSRSY